MNYYVLYCRLEKNHYCNTLLLLFLIRNHLYLSPVIAIGLAIGNEMHVLLISHVKRTNRYIFIIIAVYLSGIFAERNDFFFILTWFENSN